jgi:hypothetical protein
MAVPVKTWRESCSCAGAEEERRRQDQAGLEFPDFKEHREQYQRDAESRREAFRAVRAAAAGRSREEIRDLYEAELRSRGLPIPSHDILDARVDAITGNFIPLARLAGQSLTDVAKLLHGIFRPPR